jgi:UDP-N-acetylmuramate--alanine ligase
MLAELMRTKYAIAVTGSHGKTTTSGLIAHILMDADYDPSFAIGGHVMSANSHVRTGSGDFFVAEADESDRSLLQLNPSVAVITNIDLEHLETYKDLDDLKNTFMQFIAKLPFYGTAVVCADDDHIQSIIPIIDAKTVSYGIKKPADVYGTDIILEKDMCHFKVHVSNSSIESTPITLPVAGIHNVYNTLGAIAALHAVGIPLDTIKKSIASFKGVKRRFTFHGTYKEAMLYDDYGHHPKEIESVIHVARGKATNKLTVVFQPHRYSRTEKLWDDFLSTLNNHAIDTLIITDIYSAGEPSITNITSYRLVQELKTINPEINAYYAPYTDTFDAIIDTLNQSLNPQDLVLFLGAGKMNLVAERLIPYPSDSF